MRGWTPGLDRARTEEPDMSRAAAVALFSFVACSSPPARDVALDFREAPGGMRLVVNGVRLGEAEAAAVAALGDSGPAAGIGLHEAVLAGPGETRATVRYTARGGRVDGLWVTFDGGPVALMDARVAVSKAAMRAGATCGPSGCAVRDAAAGSAVVKVATTLSWPTRLLVIDAPPPEVEEGPRVASAR